MAIWGSTTPFGHGVVLPPSKAFWQIEEKKFKWPLGLAQTDQSRGGRTTPMAKGGWVATHSQMANFFKKIN